jgi:hypothetical protein
MTQTMSNFDSVLKEVYIGPIREQLSQEKILLEKVQRNSKDIEGKYGVVPLHTARNTGVGARADNGAMPTAGQQGYTVSKWHMKYNYGRFQVTGPTIKASKNDMGAFAKAIDANIKGLTLDVKKNVNRQLFGDSSGAVAVLTSSTVTTPLTVQGLYWAANKYLPDNQPIQTITVADYSTLRPADGATACAVNGTATATSVPFDGSVFTSAIANDLLGLYGSTYAASGTNNDSSSKELNGLRLIVDDGNCPEDADWWNQDGTPAGDYTLGLVDFNSYPTWKAVVKESDTPRTSGATLPTRRALDETLMDEVVDSIADNGGNCDLIITTRDIRRQYVDLLRGDKRFVNTTKLSGGYTAIDFNGIPIVTDSDCTRDDMYFLTMSSLVLFEESGWDWMDEDGAILSRVSGYDAYEAILFWYSQLGCYARNQNGRLTDIEAGQTS